MNEPYFEKIATECSLRPVQVKAVSDLLEDGATIPFIARYRKEATGSLDEVMVTTIRDRLSRLRELDERRKAILKSLEDQNVLTDELQGQGRRRRDPESSSRTSTCPTAPSAGPAP